MRNKFNTFVTVVLLGLGIGLCIITFHIYSKKEKLSSIELRSVMTLKDNMDGKEYLMQCTQMLLDKDINLTSDNRIALMNRCSDSALAIYGQREFYIADTITNDRFCQLPDIHKTLECALVIKEKLKEIRTINTQME